MSFLSIRRRLTSPGAAAAVACLASLHAAGTFAQPAEVRDSITQGAQADRAIEQARQRLFSGQAGEDDIGRDPGVFVLIEQDIFSVGIDAGLGYSSDVDKGDLQDAKSAYTSIQIDAGVDTRIADSFDAGARITLAETLFHDERGFDSGALIGSVYVSEAFFDRTLILTADVTGGINGGYDFDNGSAYVNASLRAARPIPLSSDIVFVPSVFASLVHADQGEQNRWEGGASGRLAMRLDDDLRLTLSAGLTYAQYDNFYEDVLFVSRQDTTAFAGIGLEYRIDENVTAFGNVRYTNRTSTLDIVEYEEVDASAMIGVRARF
jgi:opacity protein-like surface antigen